VPLVEVTWILREEYINGDPFTMGGKKVVMERVVAPPKQLPTDQDRKSPESNHEKKRGTDKEKGKVISLFERE
jgi:hypothetical protein